MYTTHSKLKFTKAHFTFHINCVKLLKHLIKNACKQYELVYVSISYELKFNSRTQRTKYVVSNSIVGFLKYVKLKLFWSSLCDGLSLWIEEGANVRKWNIHTKRDGHFHNPQICMQKKSDSERVRERGGKSLSKFLFLNTLYKFHTKERSVISRDFVKSAALHSTAFQTTSI